MKRSHAGSVGAVVQLWGSMPGMPSVARISRPTATIRQVRQSQSVRRPPMPRPVSSLFSAVLRRAKAGTGAQCAPYMEAAGVLCLPTLVAQARQELRRTPRHLRHIYGVVRHSAPTSDSQEEPRHAMRQASGMQSILLRPAIACCPAEARCFRGSLFAFLEVEKDIAATMLLPVCRHQSPHQPACLHINRTGLSTSYWSLHRRGHTRGQMPSSHHLTHQAGHPQHGWQVVEGH